MVLFDEQMHPLSERLVFSKNYDNTRVWFQTDKTVYEKREKVVVTIREVTSLTPSLLERGQGVRCSVAITDDTDIAVDSSTTILSSLLLSSELKGYIDNPAWYLQDNTDSAIALDYLMMTHGWRRYNIPEVVKGNPEYPQIPYQTSQKISGQVKSPISSRLVANSEITVMTKDGFLGSTTADTNGRFLFQGFEYPDSTLYFVQALSIRGSDRVELFLDDVSFSKPIHAMQSPVLMTPENTSIVVETDNYPSLHTNVLISKAEQRSKYDEDMRLIHLNEVEVTARRIERKEEPRLIFQLNEGSDVTIRREDFQKSPPPNFTDLLRSVPGVHILNGIPYIRNSKYSAFVGLGYPLVLIDGFENEEWKINGLDRILSVYEIESIDVFKGPSAALFGVRGSNGVISITKRRGMESINSTRETFNYAVFSPLGYQKPVEFYAPRYETLEEKYLTIPDFRTTIYWKPDVVISDTGEASFEFYTSDFPTTYSVVIEGMTTEGRIIRQVEKIRVQ